MRNKMINKICLLTVALLFLSPAAVFAEVVWEQDFDDYSMDWICCLGDCSIIPGKPPGFSGFKSNGSYIDYCASQIIEDGDRSGTSGNRGYRIKLFWDHLPSRDSMLTVSLPAGHSKLFFRWHMRESNVNGLRGFDKVLRIWSGSFQIVPEWKWNQSKLKWNIWNASNGNQYPNSTDYRSVISDDEWHCYEVMIDLANGEAKFWFDGVSSGTLTNQRYPDSTFSYFNIGGNSYGHTWSEPQIETRDYDDIVVSTERIGCGMPVSLLGDVNLDGTVNITDAVSCVNVILGFETNPDYIARAQGVAAPTDTANILDLMAIINVILEG